MTDYPRYTPIGDGTSMLSMGPRSHDEDSIELRDSDFDAPAVRTLGQGIAGLSELTDLERSERLARMRDGTLGSVHSWELVTAVDGPGTRLTVFLNGCPLRCLYCHNPDTFLMKNGAPVSDVELLSKIRRYRRVFRASGGGLTLSGGEALMQPAFVRRILRGAKELGVHTCIDTSGYLGANADDAMLDDIDLVLLDVKSGDPATYRDVTGRELQPTIDFGHRIAQRGGPTRMWIRFVLVPGFTDSPDNIALVGDIISQWKHVIDRVEVLPFHQLGRDKWETLGLDYTLNDVKPPSVEETEKIRDYFRSLGFETH